MIMQNSHKDEQMYNRARDMKDDKLAICAHTVPGLCVPTVKASERECPWVSAVE